MVRMFMCDQNAIKVTSGFKLQISFKPVSIFLPLIPVSTSTCGIVRSYINTVSAAATGNTAKSHNTFNPLFYLFPGCLQISIIYNNIIRMFPEKFFRALSGDDTLSFFSCIATAVHRNAEYGFLHPYEYTRHCYKIPHNVLPEEVLPLSQAICNLPVSVFGFPLKYMF